MKQKLPENDYDNEVIIEEAPEYVPKSDFSKAEIVKLAVDRCASMRAQEMMPGFWNTKLTKDGFPIHERKPDTRKEFIGAVEALRGLLSPEIRRDDIYKKFEKKINESKKKLWDDYAYEDLQLTTKPDNRVYGGIPIYKKTGKKYMPDLGANVTMAENQFSKQVTQGKGLWDDYVNAYWDQLLFLYDKIFQKLNDLIDRSNYFGDKLNYG